MAKQPNAQIERLNRQLKRFHMTVGQQRPRAVVLGAAWYDQLGYLRGQGDIDAADFKTISRRLEHYELFAVLKAGDALGETVTIDEVARRAVYVISAGTIYKVAGKISELPGDDKRALQFESEDIDEDWIRLMFGRRG